MQPSEETFKRLFYSDSEVQRRYFCGTCKRTENRRTCCDRLRSTSRWKQCSFNQQYSSRGTSRCIIEKHDGLDGWRYYWRERFGLWAPWPAKILEKMREYWLKCEIRSFWHCGEKSFLKHDVPQHRKDRNLSQKCTSLIRRQNHKGEVVDRSWLCVSPSQTCVKCFTCRLMCADTTKCAHCLIRKGICDWKHALERLRSH